MIDLSGIDLKPLAHHLTDDEARGFFLAEKEHYKLLAYLSTQIKGTICDIGTYKGASALALSYGGNPVYTFDVSNMIALDPLPANVHIIQYGPDCMFMGWLKAKLICLDTVHDGIHERKVIDYLIANKWKGTLVLDDIHAFPEQNKLWNDIKLQKVDMTSKGHWSGTGLIYFQ